MRAYLLSRIVVRLNACVFGARVLAHVFDRVNACLFACVFACVRKNVRIGGRT